MSKKREHSEFSKVIKKIFHAFLGGIAEGISEWWEEKTEIMHRKAKLFVYMLISILIGLVFISLGLMSTCTCSISPFLDESGSRAVKIPGLTVDI